jgi:hypothetical protein
LRWRAPLYLVDLAPLLQDPSVEAAQNSDQLVMLRGRRIGTHERKPHAVSLEIEPISLGVRSNGARPCDCVHSAPPKHNAQSPVSTIGSPHREQLASPTRKHARIRGLALAAVLRRAPFRFVVRLAMRFAWCLLLLGCGLTGSEDDPGAREQPCPERDYRIDVLLTEATCEDDVELSQDISCAFTDCESRAFSCELFDGSEAHNDGTAGPWVLEQSPGGVACTITYEVSFPRQ